MIKLFVLQKLQVNDNKIRSMPKCMILLRVKIDVNEEGQDPEKVREKREGEEDPVPAEDQPGVL